MATMTAPEATATLVDLTSTSVRELNSALHAADPAPRWTVLNPQGATTWPAG